MNRGDRQLLERQLQHLQLTRPRNGWISVALVGVFLCGLTVGGLLFAPINQAPDRAASREVRTALALFLNGAPSATRQ
jgi:hypothetical protein